MLVAARSFAALFAAPVCACGSGGHCWIVVSPASTASPVMIRTLPGARVFGSSSSPTTKNIPSCMSPRTPFTLSAVPPSTPSSVPVTNRSASVGPSVQVSSPSGSRA